MKYNFIIFFLVLNTLIFSKDIINLATDSFEPFYSPNLENNGFFSEVVTSAFNEVDVDVKIHFVPWKRAHDLAVIGKYDGLLGAFRTNERDSSFNYTDEIWLNKVSFFSKKSNGISYDGISNLLGYNIGVVRNYSYSEEFDYNNTLNKIESPTSEKNLNLLLHNRVDIIVDSEPVVFDLLNRISPKEKNDIIVIGELSKRWLHVLISKQNKDSELYVNKFNEGLKKIKLNGKFDQILKKHNIK